MAVVGFVLAVVGIISLGIPLVAAVVAGVCAFLFKATVKS